MVGQLGRRRSSTLYPQGGGIANAVKKSIHVDLIDDDEAVLDALGLYLERRGFHVSRYARAADYVKTRSRAAPCDCIVADIRMPGMSGMDLQRWLVRTGSEVPLILITGFADVVVAVAAMKAGAYDFMEKPVDERHLVASIRQAATQTEQQQAERVKVAQIATRVETLSDREREVMNLAARGRTSREIGAELGISPRTVEIHRASMMEKLGCETLADLVRFAIKLESLPHGALKKQPSTP